VSVGGGGVPPGYERLLLGHAVAVARSDVAPGIRRSLVSADGTRSTLHEFAARQTAARALAGRDTAWAITLPETRTRVVVRHNRHGGLFASLTGDRFLAPTRAPLELDVALALGRVGVATPDVVAYVLYPPGGVLQRADVATREIAGGRDLADLLGSGDGNRAAVLEAVATLVAALARAGARHHDLNARNILVTPERAYVLDVDRVTLGEAPARALAENLARLRRSLRKWRDQHGAAITEDDIGALERATSQAMARGDDPSGPAAG